jgi:putative SOS response-associated peptidase YedK
MFRDSFKKRRCLIPASGYYEWRETPEGKQPYYFTRRDGQIISIAGLWSDWTDKANGQNLKSCTMPERVPSFNASQRHVARPHQRRCNRIQAKR